MRVESLDVLRGFAASYVVVFHVLLVPPLEIGHAALSKFVKYGGISVSLFFSISALSMLLGYYNRLEGPDALRKFYIRRFFRIFPLFWFCLALHVGWRLAFKMPWNWSEVLLSATFMFPFIPGSQGSLVMAGWSLGIEWIFYVAFPLFIVVINGFWRALAGFLVTGLVAIVVLYSAGDMGPFNINMSVVKNTPRFMIGAVIFFARGEIWSAANTLARRGVPAWGLSVGLLFLGSALVVYAPTIKWQFFMSTQLAWLFFLAAAFIGFPYLLTNWFTIYIGRISYSIYLIHPLVIVGLIKAGVYSTIYSKFPSTTTSFIVSFLVSYVLTIAAASASYRLIELPGLSLGKLVVGRRSARVKEGAEKVVAVGS